MAAYSVADFIFQFVPEGEVTTVRGDIIYTSQGFGHWARRD